MAMLLMDVFGKRSLRLLWTGSACLSAFAFLIPQARLFGTAMHGHLFIDGFSWIFGSIILLSGFLVFLLGDNLLQAQRAKSSIDVDFLLLMSLAGALITVSAANMVVLFIGIELMSIPLYVLAGIARLERASAEAALKYFILGAFSSAFFLYGIVFIYGVTGSMNLLEIAQYSPNENALFLVGLGLIIFGFAFKVGLVPFHVWAPDVYQGSPTFISTFMAVIVKAAGFAAFIRVMHLAFSSATAHWEGLIWILAVLTMTVGNLAALRQQSIKRMLAYSSIAHSGYAVMGLLGLGAGQGAEAVIYYIIAYSLMTIASFGVVLLVTAGSDAQYDKDEIESLSGLGWSHPFLGVVMSVAMLSLAGIPPLAGFVGKFYIFSSVVQSGFVGLAIIAALNSVVSLYYYFRVLVVMYFKTERTVSWMPALDIPLAPALALSLATAGTLLLGVFADTVRVAVDLAVRSIG
ncbi:UNVERIFIED_CONTAM: hypothetical protein GTU68_054010 [Idotea baltica]|nr:hypothetical protein [Idotea baltica]